MIVYTEESNSGHQFFMRHKEFELEEEISQLKSIISDQNLQLLPDYEQRIQVLHELNFIDDNSRVQLKGRVACEVSNNYPCIVHV